MSTTEGEVCLSESCVMAAGTILTSLDRTVEPCDDFYQYACGGWAQRSLSLNMDRFQAIDKRNQNIISSILGSPPPSNCSHAEEKARTFYKSCIAERDTLVSEDLVNLQAVIEFAGGWNISGSQNQSMDLQERMFRLHNQLGVSVLFTWGVISENNSNHIAIVPGGWNEDYLQTSETYVKLMTGISWMLQEAAQCPPDDYLVYDDHLGEEELASGEFETVEYEYSYDVNSEKYANIFSMLSSALWPSEQAEGDQDYDFVYQLNMSDHGTVTLNTSHYPSPLLLQPGAEVPLDIELDHHSDSEKSFPLYQDSLNHKPTREECMRKLQTSLEGDSLSNLVSARLDLELMMRQVLGLEQRLSQLTTQSPDYTDGKLSPVSLAELELEFPFLNWTEFLVRGFQIIDHELEPSLTVLIDKEYLQAVSGLLAELLSSEENSVVLRNYLIWRLVATFYPSKYRDDERRGEQCLKQTEDVFGPVITAMYVRHKTVEASQTLVQEVDMMVDSMKDAFSTNLNKLPWMSENSRSAASEKLGGMMDLIGYPDHVLNSTWLNKQYEELEVSPDYLMNIIAFQSYKRKEGMRLYVNPFERGSWAEISHSGNIVSVNAFYSPNSNTMIVPIGMLQDPLYWSQPKSLTFGAFGIVVAHEITHAFDDSGINYDRDGMSAQLYDNKTIQAFHNEASCLRDQYYQYSVADTQVDGNLTLGENLADHGGLSMALEAYTNWRKHNTDVKLPALPFHDMQLFFIGYALPWCARHTDKHASHQVRNDEHAPERFRVLGPLSNSKEFSQAFSCPVNSKMNPEQKCRIW